MPRNIETEPLTKHTVFLYEGDFEKLNNSFPKIGASAAARHIIRAYLDKITKSSAPLPAEQINV